MTKILYIEDNHINICLLERMVRRLDYRVVTATKGAEGLLRFADDRPDVVIVDYRLPDMRGTEVIQHIRQSPGYPVPIIVLTADHSAAARRECDEAGCDAFITKPIKRDQLHRALKRVIPHSI